MTLGRLACGSFNPASEPPAHAQALTDLKRAYGPEALAAREAEALERQKAAPTPQPPPVPTHRLTSIQNETSSRSPSHHVRAREIQRGGNHPLRAPCLTTCLECNNKFTRSIVNASFRLGPSAVTQSD